MSVLTYIYFDGSVIKSFIFPTIFPDPYVQVHLAVLLPDVVNL